jgi:hypothetical protein
MRREELVNNAQTTLDGAATDTGTTLTVTDGSVFPSTGDFRLLIENELVLCTARSGDTLTVVRAQEGTANVSHASGIRVYQLLTHGDLASYLRDNDPLFDSLRPPFRIIDASENILTAADFTLENYGGSATKLDRGSAITLVQASSTNAILTRPISGSSWQLTAAISAVSTDNASLWGGGSIGLVDTSNKVWAFNYRQHAHTLHINRWDAGAGYVGGDTLAPFAVPTLRWMWLRIYYTGSGNVHFLMSDNGSNWLEVGNWAPDGLWFFGPFNRFFFGNINPAYAGWATLGAWDDGAGILG